MYGMTDEMITLGKEVAELRLEVRQLRAELTGDGRPVEEFGDTMQRRRTDHRTRWLDQAIRDTASDLATEGLVADDTMQQSANPHAERRRDRTAIEAMQETFPSSGHTVADVDAIDMEGIANYMERKGMKLNAALCRRAVAAIRYCGQQARLEKRECRIVFDGPPGPTAGRFVEVEDENGNSYNAGMWVERKDGMWELRLDRKFPVRPVFNITVRDGEWEGSYEDWKQRSR